jgi:hypothetical protein
LEFGSAAQAGCGALIALSPRLQQEPVRRALHHPKLFPLVSAPDLLLVRLGYS